MKKSEREALARVKALFAGVPFKVNFPFQHHGETDEQYRIRMETGVIDPALAARLEQDRLDEGRAEAAGS